MSKKQKHIVLDVTIIILACTAIIAYLILSSREVLPFIKISLFTLAIIGSVELLGKKQRWNIGLVMAYTMMAVEVLSLALLPVLSFWNTSDIRTLQSIVLKIFLVSALGSTLYWPQLYSVCKSKRRVRSILQSGKAKPEMVEEIRSEFFRISGAFRFGHLNLIHDRWIDELNQLGLQLHQEIHAQDPTVSI